MREDKSERISVDLYYRAEGAKAYGFNETEDNTSVSVWLPKSQVEILGQIKKGSLVPVEMPLWLAEKNGFC
jgi:hypothetical protein